MKTISYSEIKKNFDKILDMVQVGEEIAVSAKKGKGKIAIIIPYEKYKRGKERPLGILKGKAQVVFKENFKITDEEFLSS